MFKTKSAEIANCLLLRIFAYFCGLFVHFCVFFFRTFYLWFDAFGDQHYNSIFDNFCNTKEKVAVFFVIRGSLAGRSMVGRVIKTNLFCMSCACVSKSCQNIILLTSLIGLIRMCQSGMFTRFAHCLRGFAFKVPMGTFRRSR